MKKQIRFEFYKIFERVFDRIWSKGFCPKVAITYMDHNRFCYDETFLKLMKTYWEKNELNEDLKPVASLALMVINDELDNCLGETNSDGFLFEDGE